MRELKVHFGTHFFFSVGPEKGFGGLNLEADAGVALNGKSNSPEPIKMDFLP
jgi:hypothetical protein